MVSVLSVCAALLLTASVLVSAHKEHPNDRWNVAGVKVLTHSYQLEEQMAMGASGAPFSASLDAFDVEALRMNGGLRFVPQASMATSTASYGISWSANTSNPLPDLAAFVTVNFWSVGGSPNASDIIAVFYEGANITTTSPIKYVSCSHDPNYLTTGNGSLSLYLVNGRQSVWFGFFLQAALNSAVLSPSSSTLINPILAAYTPALAWKSSIIPMHPRIALSNTVGEVVISWTQNSATQPVLKLGTTSGSYTKVLTPSSTSYYNQSSMCGAPANSAGWVDPGRFYTVKASGLTAGQKYYYTFGDASSGLWSSTEYSFIVPSQPATGNGKSWTAFLFGDLGTDLGSFDNSKGNGNEGNDIPALNVSSAMITEFNRLRQANANEDVIVMHFGDISYANGWEADWDYFHYEISPLAGNIPWMTGEGNHERDTLGTNDASWGNDSGGECGIPYQTRFVMPRIIDNQRGDYWSINYNNVHFVMWDTEIPYAVNTPQWLWLQNDLANVNRCVTPYIISMSHRPMLIDSTNVAVGGSGAQPTAADLRANIEPLFQKYKVDLHLMGHHHSYQRSCPAYNATCVTGNNFGTVYVVVGTAGASFTDDQQKPPSSWLRNAIHDKNGYLHATITDSSMSFIFYNTNNGDQGINLDSFTLQNQGLCTSPQTSAALNFGMSIVNAFFPVFVLLFLVFWH